MEKQTIDLVWVAGTLFAAMGVGFGWYIVRLDHHVEKLRDEVIKMRGDIGKLQNADVTCTNDQTILKHDMSSMRDAMLKLISKRTMRRKLRRELQRD